MIDLDPEITSLSLKPRIFIIYLLILSHLVLIYLFFSHLIAELYGERETYESNTTLIHYGRDLTSQTY